MRFLQAVGTTLRLVPGRMPVVTDDFDCRASRPGGADVYDDLYGRQVIGDSCAERHGRVLKEQYVAGNFLLRVAGK